MQHYSKNRFVLTMDNIYVCCTWIGNKHTNVLQVVYSPCNTMSWHFTDLVVNFIVKQCDFFIVVDGFESFKEIESSNVAF